MSTNRRRMLCGTLTGAALAAVGVPVTRAVPADPVVDLGRLYVEADHRMCAASDAAMAVREALVREYGGLTGNQSAASVWGHDPRYPRMVRLSEESDTASCECLGIEDRMIATPPTTPEGAAVMIRIALGMLPRDLDGCDYSDLFAYAALCTAMSVLGHKPPEEVHAKVRQALRPRDST